MTTSKDNVLTMIDAFVEFRTKGNFGEVAADQLLATLVQNSRLPSYQIMNLTEENVEIVPIKIEDATAEQQHELLEVESLIEGKMADNALWENYDDLYALVTKYPPVLLEQTIIIGMMVYLLRSDNVDFDAETDTFCEFFAGWGSVVIGYCQ